MNIDLKEKFGIYFYLDISYEQILISPADFSICLNKFKSCFKVTDGKVDCLYGGDIDQQKVTNAKQFENV
jgi:hypothetical protein